MLSPFVILSIAYPSSVIVVTSHDFSVILSVASNLQLSRVMLSHYPGWKGAI